MKILKTDYILRISEDDLKLIEYALRQLIDDPESVDAMILFDVERIIDDIAYRDINKD